MYDNFKTANYSKALVSPEIYARPLSRLFTGEVIDGFTVVPKTGLTVTLKPGNAFVRYGSTNVASARLVSLVADFDLTHDAKDVSNPRFDLIVVYVDNAVSLPSGTPTSANLDGPGVAKAKIVKGVPNATPVVPNDTSIQASVGAGNPYIVVASDRVDAAVISIDKITDVRVLASANLAPGTVTSEVLADAAVPGEKLGTPVAFSAYRESGFTVSSNTNTFMVFDTEAFDTGSDYNPATGVFTAPYKGIYHFDTTAGIGSVNSTTLYTLSFVLTTQGICRVFEGYTAGSSTPFIPSGGRTFKMTAGDTCKVNIYHNYGSARNMSVGQDETEFSGFLVGRTA